MNSTSLSRTLLVPASFLVASALGSAIGRTRRDGSISAVEPKNFSHESNRNRYQASYNYPNAQEEVARNQEGDQISAHNILATSATVSTSRLFPMNSRKKSTTDFGRLGSNGGGCDRSTTASTTTDNRSKLIFLGTGSSTGCPKPLCTMLFANEHLIEHTTGDVLDDDIYKRKMGTRCKVSSLAIQGGDPKSNKNYRNNPSFLIHHYPATNSDSSETPATSLPKNIIIDVGKTFREGALRWFPHYNIRSLDAIILTHHHMDAAAGLDDVRGFQRTARMLTPSSPSTTHRAITGPPPTRVAIPIYVSQFCYDDLSDRFPWLLPRTEMEGRRGNAYTGGQITNDPKVVVKRDVASFNVQVVENYKSFHPAGDDGLKVTPLPVWHGDDLISLGFSIIIQHDSDGEKKSTHVVYLSDISRMVPETLDYIQSKLPPTDILVVDSLLWHRPHPVHYSLDQAMQLAQDDIRPKVGTYLIGMSCDDFLDHDSMNHYLKESYPHDNVQFAYDGLVIEL